MKMLWNGGYSYSIDPASLDPVRSLPQAVALCEHRENNRDGHTPCVQYGHNAHAAWVYQDPDNTLTDSTDMYPDYIIRVKVVTDKAGEHLGYRYRPEPA